MAIGPGPRYGGATPTSQRKPARRRHVRAVLGPARKGAFGTPIRKGARRQKPKVTVPWRDQQYANDLIGLDYKRQSTLNSLKNQQQQTRLSYGLDTDPVANPYSRAALLQRNYERARQGSTNAAAASGRLYSGSLSNALARDRANYDSDHDTLSKGYSDALAKLGESRSAADAEFRLGKVDAQQAAIARAMKNRPTAQTSPIRPRKAKRR